MTKYLLIGLVGFYRVFLSSLFPSSCIYKISCSSFMLLMLKKHGVWLGSFFGIKRIFSCHSFAATIKEDRQHV